MTYVAVSNSWDDLKDEQLSLLMTRLSNSTSNKEDPAIPGGKAASQSLNSFSLCPPTHTLNWFHDAFYQVTDHHKFEFLQFNKAKREIEEAMELSRDIHAGDLADDMEAASASGDLIQVKALLEQWHATGKRVPPDGFCCDPEDPFPMSMIAAIKNQRLDVIACFLDEGFPICAAGSATASKVGSVDVYQTFLDHGWDINELPAMGCAALK